MKLKGKKVLIVGGGSGIGKAVAKAACDRGASVMIASRNRQKLMKAAPDIGKDVQIGVLDVTKEEEVKAFFEGINYDIDHLVATPASPESRTAGVMAPVENLPIRAARQFMETKYWGQVLLAKYGAHRISSHGSITLTAGIASKRYAPNHCGISPTNAAIGAFAWLLAQEIGPKRVNAIAPGLVFTEAYDHMPKASRERFFDNYGQKFLPVKHVAIPEEIARAYIYVMECDYHTGDVLCCDGGFWSAKEWP
jgi:NAD(P)-dependent dehydrogenase (short-subunit alcohol dehydrogenase family)